MSLPSEGVRAADIIHRSFDEYHSRFRSITRRARARYEQRDWDGIRRDTVKRLGLHQLSIDETFAALREELAERLADRELWVAMKDAYSRAILGRDDFELAQTFFNSLTRRVFPHDGVDPMLDFVADDFPLPYRGWEMASARMYAVHRVDPVVLQKVIEDAGFRVPFQDLENDVASAARRIEEGVISRLGVPEFESLDVLRPVLIRNKAAYVIGRVRRGEELMPVVLALLNEEGGLRLDAVLTTEDETSIVFSFARWYFHADLASPREAIGFLHSILPRKRVAELYISLGYNKHGKTEFYRDLMKYISASDEQFVVAPGEPGQVMSVFTLPSYEFVFKVIKDTFPPNKKTTRAEVERKYREVLRHDRVGRLVDFQEFEHLKFGRGRFADPLLEELLAEAGGTVALEGPDVIVRHVYVGRRVTPLDLYVRERPAVESVDAVVDWGYALKDLAAANIFAGDMLLKNFGVTRHGRVVFYDYDELCPLVDCNFREFPTARDYDDEMSDEPWFSVSPQDVFPEELRTFLELGGPLLETFIERHGDLFSVGFWRGLQERNRQGEIIDFFPYTPAQRLAASVR